MESASNDSDNRPPDSTACPQCGALAEIISGFVDGLDRGSVSCPNCGVIHWPPRQC